MNNSSSQRSCCSVRVFSQLGSVSQGMTYRISRLLHTTLPSALAPKMTILFAASCHFCNSQLTPIYIMTSSISYSTNRGFMPWVGSEGLPARHWHHVAIDQNLLVVWRPVSLLLNDLSPCLIWTCSHICGCIYMGLFLGYIFNCLGLWVSLLSQYPMMAFIYFAVLFIVQMKWEIMAP